jgi:AraC-like DNA-binding protein
MTVDADALAQVLGSVDVRIGRARRAELSDAALLPVASGRVTLVYVAEGSVVSPLAPSCRLDVARDAAQIGASPSERSRAAARPGRRAHLAANPDQLLAASPDQRPFAAAGSGRRAVVAVSSDVQRTRLAAGDAFLTLGQRPFVLAADGPASLRVVDLELSESATRVTAVLPEIITVTGFDALEPAAAALAEHLGQAEPDACALRTGDPIICRMMVTTVLLSVIRAWAENGCAPDGWPGRATDPFLDRVVEAIHEEPGRDWTLEMLAGVGAMSRSVFAERFRRALGSSPANYVTRVRMDAAQRMLRAGHTVSETSRELGYASDEGFSRAFRRHTGMTPSAWRAAHRVAVPA